MPLAPLPIDDVLPQAVDALPRHPGVVLQAPTGAGKTTRVPPALLDSGLLGEGQLLLLEPRRLAARAAARRMASERGTPLGEEIGYHVRFDRRSGPGTRVLAVTPGILLRRLHDDPFLESVRVVVFDEFHERGLENDLAFGMVRLLQQTVRPELRVVVMSATLDTGRIARALGDAPVVVSEGRLYPVDIRHEAKRPDLSWSVAVVRAVAGMLDETPGDLLVFLPGLGEIRQTARQLEALAAERDLLVLPLHGDLPLEQQDAALLPQARRKVVLATNVAETSVTVEGVTGVIDTGLARVLVYDPSVGLDRLQLTPISRNSAQQRAGRAGRTQPGVCLRLWGASAHLGRPEQLEPEVRRVDLAGALLQLMALGEADVRQFPWLDPPPEATGERSLQLLRQLGAIGDNGVTPLGEVLARLPVHPRLGRLLIEAHRRGCGDRGALAAALLAERDPFARPEGREPPKRTPAVSDLLQRVEAAEEFERTGRLHSEAGTLHKSSAKFVLQARDQLTRAVRQELKQERRPDRNADPDEAFLRAVLAAFPDRVARRREPGSPRGVMVGGRGVCLAPTSAVAAPELFVCVDVDAGQAETTVRVASGIERDWLDPGAITTTTAVSLDPEGERVVAVRRTCFHDLVLEERPVKLPESKEVTRVLAEAASAQLPKVLPAEDSPARRYLTRVRCLRGWMPELELPAFADSDLRELLPWVCQGRKSFAEVRAAPWLDFLQGKLTPRQLQAVEREAPERIEVPSGSRITLKYEVGRPPVLAVRIQEVFGLADTPRVAGGRVKVLMHLLAPNYRPQQVTEDLASFWANTYPQVRKELRARYPRHAWPEDPWSEPPRRGPRRRG